MPGTRHPLRAHRARQGLRLAGTGAGAQDKARTWLVQKNEVLAFSEAPEREGGAGALLVLLRQAEGARK